MSSLIKRNAVYHLRVGVPVRLQPLLIKKELHFSLKTGNVRLAKQKAKVLDRAFTEVTGMPVRKISRISPEQFRQMIRDYVTGKLQEFELEQATAGRGNPGRLYKQLREYDDGLFHLKLAYTQGCHVQMKGKTVAGMGIDLSEADHQILCRELLKADIRTLEAASKRLTCELEGTDLESIWKDLGVSKKIHATHNTKSIPEPTNAGPMLADLLADFQEMKVKSKKWTPNTVRTHTPKMDTMLAQLGADRPVGEISVADVRKMAENIKDKDVSTQRDYLNLAKSVFRYALDNEFVNKNPVLTGMIPPKKLNTREQKLPFDDPGDLSKIFGRGWPEWTAGQPARYWLPVLALYTGCRLEELASLYTEHVHKVDGIICIEINDDYDRKVKNLNAIRTVPLHPVVAEGFAAYVAGAKLNGGRVFPELRMVNYKYGHEFSKRFSYYLRKKVEITDPKKVFHSFRHNVSDHLYKKLVTESLIEELTGRAGKTETSRRYVTGHRVATLYKECVLKLDYNFEL
jgi:integrase